MTTFLILLGAFVGGAFNALAGGGTFLIFPALLLTGIAPVQANATASLVVLPGAFVSAWVYRDGLQFTGRRSLAVVLVASLLGSVVGGLLLLRTPNATFSSLVPWLLLIASAVFTAAPWLRKSASAFRGRQALIALAAGQAVISVYGGYFGAGMGVLMIALYLLATTLNVQSANAVRIACGCVINATAVVIFAWRGALVYRLGVPMLIAAILGGYIGAVAVKRLNTEHARIAMLVYAWALTGWFFLSKFVP